MISIVETSKNSREKLIVCLFDLCVYKYYNLLGYARSKEVCILLWCNLQQSAASFTVPMVVVMISSVSNGIERLFFNCIGMQRLFNRCNGTLLLFLKNLKFKTF